MRLHAVMIPLSLRVVVAGMSVNGRNASVRDSPSDRSSATYKTRSTACTASHRRPSARHRGPPTSDHARRASTTSAASSGWLDLGPR